MMKFNEIAFGDIASFRYGKMPDKKKITENGAYPIFSGYRITGYYDEYNLEKDELVIVARGVGGTGDVKLSPSRCYLTNLSITAEMNEDVVLKKYLYYYFAIRNLRYLDSGSAQSQITISDLEKVLIPVPSLNDQKRIVAVLSSLDDKIELNNRINANLEQQAQAIFKSWFVDFEPHGGKMPKDWKKEKLGSFVEIKRGGSPRPIQDYLSNRGYRWLKISDVTSLNSPYILEIKEHIREEGLKKTVFLKQGSLVLSNSATPGIPKFLDVDSCIHDGWLYFPDSQLSNEYLYLLFTFIRNDLVKLGNGSVFTNLKTDILRQFEIIMPTGLVLSDFQDIILPLFELIKNNTRENQSLSVLRDSLLPKLMNGEIDVSDVEI